MSTARVYGRPRPEVAGPAKTDRRRAAAMAS
jgi:hypothetical protein